MYTLKNDIIQGGNVSQSFIFSPINYLQCLAHKHRVIKPEAIKVSASLANQVSSPRDVTRQQGEEKKGGGTSTKYSSMYLCILGNTFFF